MKHIAVLFLIIFSAASQEVLDEILAVVGNEIITKSELDQAVMQMKFQRKLTDQQAKEQRPQIFKQMVDENLLYIRSQLDSIEITDDQLNQEADNRWRQLVNQVSSYGGEAYLEQVYNSKVRDIRKRQKKKIKRDMAIMQMRNQRMQTIRVSRDDVYKFYNTYKDSLPVQPERLELANIVMRAKAGAEKDKEAYEKALSTLEKLKAGGDFVELAKELSEGPSGPKGGALGKVAKGNFVKEYEDAAYSLSTGEISQEPVKSDYGYHIIKLHSKNDQEFESSHILFMAQVSQDDLALAKARLDSIRSEIVSEKLSFEDAANKYSEDPSSNTKGGYIGIFPVSSIPNKQTKDALEFANTGDLTSVFALDNQTIQLIKVIRRIPATEYDVDRDFSAIESMAIRFRQTDAFKKLLADLKRDIPVELR